MHAAEQKVAVGESTVLADMQSVCAICSWQDFNWCRVFAVCAQ